MSFQPFCNQELFVLPSATQLDLALLQVNALNGLSNTPTFVLNTNGPNNVLVIKITWKKFASLAMVVALNGKLWIKSIAIVIIKFALLS